MRSMQVWGLSFLTCKGVQALASPSQCPLLLDSTLWVCRAERGLQNRGWRKATRPQASGFTDGPGRMVGSPGMDPGLLEPRESESEAGQGNNGGRAECRALGTAPAGWRRGRRPEAGGYGGWIGGDPGPRLRGPRWVARGRGGRRLAAGSAGGAGGSARRGPVNPQPGLGLNARRRAPPARPPPHIPRRRPP